MRVAVTGASGFIGRRLLARLDRPIVLTRDPARAQKTLGNVNAIAWSPREGPPRDVQALEGLDAVIHLAGETVMGRWTAAKKAAIRDSRVAGTRNLIDGLAALGQPPKTFLCASAVGFYGDRGDELLDESSSPGAGFLTDICRGWEAEAAKAELLGMRVVLPRIGMVLGPGGGALAKMLTPFKLGLGGRVGSGQQWTPWVHLDDVVDSILFALVQPRLRGPFNAVGPAPVTNADFTRALAHALHRPAVFPVPAWVLKLAFGEFSSLLLASQRVLPKALERAGYRFHYPRVGDALAAAVAGAAAPPLEAR